MRDIPAAPYTVADALNDERNAVRSHVTEMRRRLQSHEQNLTCFLEAVQNERCAIVQLQERIAAWELLSERLEALSL